MKNYTSAVPVERTIAQIEKTLAKAGACDILKEYDSGQVAAVSFTVINPHESSKRIAIRLPANAKAVERVLRKRVRRPQSGTNQRIADQAGRTAWKIIQDWIEVQISLIEMEQAEFLQVFLPYICVQGRKTFYSQLRESGFKLLGPG